MNDPDVEIKSVEYDVLNRDRFARDLANGILSYNQSESLTIGILGSWGSGKSSLINLIGNVLKKEDCILIRFDPWFFSNQDNLYLQFFKLIISTLKKEEIKTENIFESKIKPQRRLFKKPDSSLENYFKYIKDSSIELNINDLDFILNSDSLESYDSLKFHKTQCEKSLDDLKRKIVVIIDDIDRLKNNEIAQIFTLVKSLANFKQFIYILSFDKEIVAKAINDYFPDFGDKYIDKIVQIPITVPEISDSKMDELILSEIEPIYIEHLEKFYNDGNQFNKIIDFLKIFIKNIRDLKRYKNILNFYVDSFAFDLNINDFFLILTIQLFNHNLFLKIKGNKDELIIDDSRFNDNIQEIRFFDYGGEFIKDIGDDWVIFKEVLIFLFPHFDSEKNPITKENYKKWEDNHNICIEEYFEKYFTLSLDSIEVSEKLLDRLVHLDDIDKIIEIFTFESNLDYNHSLLTQFRQSIPRIPNINAEFFIKALMKCGDQMDVYSVSRHHMEWIFDDLFNKIGNETKRFEILKECVGYESNILTVSEYIYSLAFDYGLAGRNTTIKSEEEMSFSLKHVEQLIDLNVSKINDCSKDKNFLNQTFLQDMLTYWELLGDEKTVKDYVLNNVNSDEEILYFLSRFRTRQRTTLSSFDVGSKSEMIFDFGKLDSYHGLEFYENKINDILSKNISEDINEFCELFIEQLNEYKMKYNI